MEALVKQGINQLEELKKQINDENISKRQPTYEELEAEVEALREELRRLKAGMLELISLAS